MYKEQQVCQRHYFRFMRNGTYERVLKRTVFRLQDPRGYWQLYLPEHPLADSTGQVWEHRKIVYDRIGDTLPPCELCGRHITWKSAHIDHIDEDPSNNDPKNLRPLCRGCNVSRTPRAGSVILTIDGVAKSALSWSRDPRVYFCYRSILRRKASGMSDFDVLFGKKLTHNGNRAEIRRLPKEKAMQDGKDEPRDGFWPIAVREMSASLDQLLHAKAELDARIEQIQREEKAMAIASISALMQSHGVTLADLGATKRRVSVGLAKYRDPLSGKTWTGRGRPPAWIAGDKESYRIAA